MQPNPTGYQGYLPPKNPNQPDSSGYANNVPPGAMIPKAYNEPNYNQVGVGYPNTQHTQPAYNANPPTIPQQPPPEYHSRGPYLDTQRQTSQSSRYISSEYHTDPSTYPQQQRQPINQSIQNSSTYAQHHPQPQNQYQSNIQPSPYHYAHMDAYSSTSNNYSRNPSSNVQSMPIPGIPSSRDNSSGYPGTTPTLNRAPPSHMPPLSQTSYSPPSQTHSYITPKQPSVPPIPGHRTQPNVHTSHLPPSSQRFPGSHLPTAQMAGNYPNYPGPTPIDTATYMGPNQAVPDPGPHSSPGQRPPYNTYSKEPAIYPREPQPAPHNYPQPFIQDETEHDIYRGADDSEAISDFTPDFVKRLGASVSGDLTSAPRPLHPGPAIDSSPLAEKVIEADKYTHPPPSNSPYIFVDKGSASMKFMRLTLSSCPGLIGHQYSTNIPFACIIQPFVDQHEKEQPVPVVDLTAANMAPSNPENNSDIGPIRCIRCKAYINPFMVYERSKSVFTCNLCSYQTKVPDFYLPILEKSPKKIGNFSRPELSFGSVDFVASQAYSLAAPKAPRFCIIIENTYAARYMNLTNCAINAVKQAITHIEAPYLELSIITFDETIQFYSLDFSKDIPQWKLLMVSDVNDPFIPAPDNTLFINITENRDLLDKLLTSIPSMTSETTSNLSAANAALMAAVRLISSSGPGLVNLFCCSVPNFGLGALHIDPKAKEKLTPELLNPTFYEDLLRICYKCGISIDLHCLPNKNTTVHLYSLAYPVTETGGKVYFTKDFEWEKDYDKLYYDLMRSLTKPMGFDCTVKIRTGKSLSISKLSTPFTHHRSVHDSSSFKIPRLDADSAFAVEIKVEESITDVQYVYLQAACLYTTILGSRHIRVHTLAIPVSNSMQMTFRQSDMDSITNYISRTTCLEVLKGKTNWKENLQTLIIDILYSYRYNIPQNPSPEQLFLPESIKLLPIYYLGLLKHMATRQMKSLGDEQIWFLYYFLSAPCMYTLPLLYPRIFPIHRSYTKRKNEIINLPKVGQPSEIPGQYYLPESITARADVITTDGVYIFDCGNLIILYVGNDVSPEYISAMFGSKAATHELPLSEWKILDHDMDSPGALVNKLIKQIQSERRSFSYPIVRMILPGSNQENNLRKYFVEDGIAGQLSYIELLGEFHKAIIHKMQNY